MMPVTIRQDRDRPSKKKAAPEPPSSHQNNKIVEGRKATLDPAQFEVFGRLRMTQKQMASWYGITTQMMSLHMRKPHLREAYDRGRSQCVVAIRQKQLQLALGGNVTMLLHAGLHFGEQDQPTEMPTPEDAGHTWDGTIKSRAEEIRARILGKTVEEDVDASDVIIDSDEPLASNGS